MEKKINFEEFDARVDRFLRHQMAAEEELAFKSELKADSEKNERARITALMVKTMNKEGQRQDMTIVNEIRNMSESQFLKAVGLRPLVIKLWPRYVKYATAACFIGLMIFGGYRYYDYNQTVSLGNSQYMTYVCDISETEYVRGITDNETIKRLEKLFANVKDCKDIDNTISELETIYSKASDDDSAYSDFQDDIAWNLAIAYLKNGERKKPILLLEDMIRRNADYPQISQPAQNLINQIRAL